MIFYRLTDEQARSATTALVMGVPVTAFLGLHLADAGRANMAMGFSLVMLTLFALIGVQIVQSRRLNRDEREDARG